jgi:hypothetical protein
MDAEGSMLLDLHDEELAARLAVSRSPRVEPESEQGQEERVHSPFFYVFFPFRNLAEHAWAWVPGHHVGRLLPEQVPTRLSASCLQFF